MVNGGCPGNCPTGELPGGVGRKCPGDEVSRGKCPRP